VVRFARPRPPTAHTAHSAHAARADLLNSILDAEQALAAGTDPQLLAEQGRLVSGARTVWLARPDASVARAGPALPAVDVDAALREWPQHPRRLRPGLIVCPAGSGCAAFAFDADDADEADLPAVTAAVARWMGQRLARQAGSDETGRAARAELRALRAQISPHFIFNAMGAIATLIRVDPERAHALLLDFADYTRYSFGRHGEYTSFAEELRSTEIYLSLERARFGERLSVHVTAAPEVLGVPFPFLVLQPLVENAVRHGIEPLARGGHISVQAYDDVDSVRVEVEDDGAGTDPDALEALLADRTAPGVAERSHVGLRNIDERLRAVYGDEHGLIVDTAVGAGTRVTVRVPKYRPEVRA
jgi:two-component system LytT family sensor kinase